MDNRGAIMGTRFFIEEEVLEYEQCQLDVWKSGDKSLIPDFLDNYSDYTNQPSNHFGEIFVLAHYNKFYGWKGFRFYALGAWELNNPKYDKSREKIGKLFSRKQMAQFLEARVRENKRVGKGEPDLMLYDDKSNVMFIEVKKESDTITAEQLRCLAQIKAILKADVKIVYLKEKTKSYTPKKYELDLVTLNGKRVYPV